MSGNHHRPHFGAGADDRVAYINLFAFANSAAPTRAVVAAGATGVVVDWERRGKDRRQAGSTPRSTPTPPGICRGTGGDNRRGPVPGEPLVALDAGGDRARHRPGGRRDPAPHGAPAG